MNADGYLSVMLPRWAVIRDARRRQRRRLRRRALLVLTLAVVGAGLLTQLSGAGSPNPRPSASTRPISSEVGGLGGYVLAAQSAGTRVWVLTCVQLCGAGDTGLDRERLVELDAATGAVIRRLPVETNLAAFIPVGGSVWTAHFLSGEVTRVDPAGGRITLRLRLRLPTAIGRQDHRYLPEDLAYVNGYVWASSSRGWLAQIDARTGRLARMVRTPSEEFSIATDRHHTIWIAEGLDGIGRLPAGDTRVELRTIMQAGLQLDVYRVIADGDRVWALADPASTGMPRTTIVLTIDPRSGGILHRVRVQTATSGAVATGGVLYLADLAHGRIYRVSSSGASQMFDVPRHHAWLAAATPGLLWAAIGAGHGGLISFTLPRA